MRQLLSCPCLSPLGDSLGPAESCTMLWIQAVLFHRSFTFRSSIQSHLPLATTCPTGQGSLQVLSGQDELLTALPPACAIHQAHLISTSFSESNRRQNCVSCPQFFARCNCTTCENQILPRRTVKPGLFSSTSVREIFFLLKDTTGVLLTR